MPSSPLLTHKAPRLERENGKNAKEGGISHTI
jgi:hypothetical protein